MMDNTLKVVIVGAHAGFSSSFIDVTQSWISGRKWMDWNGTVHYPGRLVAVCRENKLWWAPFACTRSCTALHQSPLSLSQQAKRESMHILKKKMLGEKNVFLWNLAWRAEQSGPLICTESTFIRWRALKMLQLKGISDSSGPNAKHSITSTGRIKCTSLQKFKYFQIINMPFIWPLRVRRCQAFFTIMLYFNLYPA